MADTIQLDKGAAQAIVEELRGYQELLMDITHIHAEAVAGLADHLTELLQEK